MKKSVLLMLLFSTLLLSNINAQELKNAEGFYKTTTHLLTAIKSFEEVNNGEIEKENAIDLIKKNLIAINSVYDNLKSKYQNDVNFKEYELWVLSIKNSLEMLIGNDITYVLASALVKMDIYDFINTKY